MIEKEKQIEEMANEIEIIGYCDGSVDFYKTASRLYRKGYRKQSEGEWIQQLRPYEDEIVCSVCGANFNIIDNCTERFNFCPNCGAEMRKEDEGK